MFRLPLVGRLSLADYRRITLTWLLLLVETLVRWIFWLIPTRVSAVMDRWRYRWVGQFPRMFRSAEEQRHPLADLQHTVDMCAYWGHAAEEYLAETKDGFRLGIHRILPATTAADISGTVVEENEITPTPGKPRNVVLLMHGFMMNSEVWLSQPQSRAHNLALVLTDLGYDVWLGNVRGNKYSCGHVHRQPDQTEFWDFGLDEYALTDLPTIVDFVLEQTGASSLTYVGFSQGTTICFAALSLLPKLRSKINLFVALAPSTKPFGLTNSFIASCIRSSPELIYLVFGRLALLSSVLFYQDVLTARFLVYVIDRACKMLFNWTAETMSLETRDVAYQHLYSFCSVKVMVHWFQIIREQRFQMYDNMTGVGMSAANTTRQTLPMDRMLREHQQQQELEQRAEEETTMYPGKMSRTQFTAVPSSPSSKSARTHLLYRPKAQNHHFQGNSSEKERPDARYRGSPSIGHIPTGFPVQQLHKSGRFPSPPIAIFYGGSDTLPDMEALLQGINFFGVDFNEATRNLVESHRSKKKQGVPPGQTLSGKVLHQKNPHEQHQQEISSPVDSPLVFLKCLPAYEHLSLLWADSCNMEVIPDVVKCLQTYAK